MKKLIALILVFTLLFTLAGCGGSEAAPSGGRSEAPSSGEAQSSGTSSSSSSAVPVAPSTSQTGTPEQEQTEDASNTDVLDNSEGSYEGETDANGKYTGWGIWIYRNFRYEGYFVDGVPNGEGTLYEAKEVGEKIQGESDDPSERVVYGQWVNGQGNGKMTITDVHEGYTNVWKIETIDGLSAESGRIEGVCSGPEVDTQSVYMRTAEGRQLALVPPWAAIATNSLAAPAGNGAPPTHSQSTESATSTPDTTATVQAEVPNNGTPPAIAAPIESHSGDKGYFYVLSDDYMVWINVQSGFQEYHLVSFDSDGNIIRGSHFSKAVFGNDADAAAYAATENWRVQIGNVVYIDTSLIVMAELMYTTKEGAITNNQQYTHFISKP